MHYCDTIFSALALHFDGMQWNLSTADKYGAFWDKHGDLPISRLLVNIDIERNVDGSPTIASEPLLFYY